MRRHSFDTNDKHVSAGYHKEMKGFFVSVMQDGKTLHASLAGGGPLLSLNELHTRLREYGVELPLEIYGYLNCDQLGVGLNPPDMDRFHGRF